MSAGPPDSESKVLYLRRVPIIANIIVLRALGTREEVDAWKAKLTGNRIDNVSVARATKTSWSLTVDPRHEEDIVSQRLGIVEAAPGTSFVLELNANART